MKRSCLIRGFTLKCISRAPEKKHDDAGISEEMLNSRDGQDGIYPVAKIPRERASCHT